MNRLIRCVVAWLAVIPLVVFAVTQTAPAAKAEDNGVGLTPAMGWSSWSFIRHDPTEADIEAQAKAMKDSGLASVGYQYVNVDDFWYECPSGQGPNVDQYGRWVVDPTKFPSSGSLSGIAAVARYVHSLGLKFGLYVTPGISEQAVAENTPIEGTSYTADEIAEPSDSEANYNCGGMDGIDYSKPGAQAFINSWADELASWGVDYLKLDGVGSFDIPDVQAWSNALRQTGRPIHLELSNSLDTSDASTWQQYANGWRTGGDIEDYGDEPSGSSYPLTDWANVESRFDQVAQWQPYGEPGAYNDYDSVEVGNGSNDGITYDERQTQLSLWSLASAPLLLGSDLTKLNKDDLSLLLNRSVIAVDQDGIDASRLADTGTEQVFAKTEKNGTVVAGLFNTSGSSEVISTTASALGLGSSPDYLLNNLWTHQSTESTGTISADVPSHGVALLSITPTKNPAAAAPAATVNLSGLGTLTGGQPATATASFTNNGPLPALNVRLGLQVPSGWSQSATTPRSFAAVGSGKTVQATFKVTAVAPDALSATSSVTTTAGYTWAGRSQQSLSAQQQVTTSPPVKAPYQAYSSATDASAVLGQYDQEFSISGGGAALDSGTDAYSTIYQKGAVGSTAAITTEITSQQNVTGSGEAGIIVRNDMAGSGSTPEGVTLSESPSGGIQLAWDNDSGTYLNSVTPADGTNPELLPLWLELVRSGTTYTGYYSFDGTSWMTVGSATVPGQAATQDAGLFLTSGTAGSPGEAIFNGFGITASDTAPPAGAVYAAASPANTLGGYASVGSCSTCYGGEKVGYVGVEGTLTFNNVTAATAGTYTVTIVYCDGSGRQADVSVNGGTAQLLSFTPTGSFTTVGAKTISLSLAAGDNTIEIDNPTDWAPDINEIVVAPTPAA